MAKSKMPVKKAHIVTGAIALVVVVGFLWVINNVQVAQDAAIKTGLK